MPDTWTHPELGQFKYDAPAWVATVRVPAFDAFSYDTGYGNAGKPNGQYELHFEADDEDETPSDAAVKVALAVLADPTRLVGRVISALWEDFNGRGPESGMWWHGDLDQVVEPLEDEGLAAPAKADDLLPLLRLSQVTIRKNTAWDDGKPCAELVFHAPFEEEHGVGVLTDGQAIFGTGYSVDVQPFKQPKRS